MPTPQCPPADTLHLHHWVERLRAGDSTGGDELLRAVARRLEGLARRMLRGRPAVRRWADTDDVLQNALLRLLRALRTVRPDSMRSFYGLAAEVVRRELLDLARHFYGPEGLGANCASHEEVQENPAALDPPAPLEAADELETWCAFHVEVAGLAPDEREVVGLIFYHGWKQAEVARLLQVQVRTVQRRWKSALATLHRRLIQGGWMPEA